MAALNVPSTTKTIREERWTKINANVRDLRFLNSSLEMLCDIMNHYDDELQTINSPMLFTCRNLAIIQNRTPEDEIRYEGLLNTLPYYRHLISDYIDHRKQYEKQMNTFVNKINDTNKLLRENNSQGLYWLFTERHGNYLALKAIYRESSVNTFEKPPLFSVPTKIPETPKPTQKSKPIPVSPSFKPPRFGLKDREMLKLREFTVAEDQNKRTSDETPDETPRETPRETPTLDEDCCSAL